MDQKTPKRGRKPKAEEKPTAKLDRLQIKAGHVAGKSDEAMAKEFGVDVDTLRKFRIYGRIFNK